MSKSLGNGIDPLEVIAQYGADALRFTLVTGNSPGNDLRFSQEKVEASRNFANKIWNASRFILMNIDGQDVPNQLPEKLALEDKWIVNQFNQVVKEVTDNLEHFEIGIAVQKLYDFLWDELCDWYIEIAKIRMNSDDAQTAQNAREVLVWVMTGTLKLLHPFMPFITEEILERGLAGVRETGACVVGMPSKDTVKLSDEDGFVGMTPERKQVWTIQTPQIFSYDLIRKAHESIRKKDMSTITDDAMVVEQESGVKVCLVEGSYHNIKITTPEDLDVAEVFLKKIKKCKNLY